MDYPRRIIQEFAIVLELPFTNITNCAIKSGVFPDAYEISEIVPIPIENPPYSLKDLRPISKTPIGGKNHLMNDGFRARNWHKNTFNDPTQNDSTKGSNTTHFLIKSQIKHTKVPILKMIQQQLQLITKKFLNWSTIQL